MSARINKVTEGKFSDDIETQIDPGPLWRGLTPERLLNYGTLYVSGEWTMDPNEKTFSMTCTYTFYDYADFHPWIPWIKPEGKSVDTLGWLAENWWNRILLLGIHNYCFGKKAQAYEIFIECGTITTTVSWATGQYVGSGWPFD